MALLENAASSCQAELASYETNDAENPHHIFLLLTGNLVLPHANGEQFTILQKPESK